MNKLAYIKSCSRCMLSSTRRMIVLGRGKLPADILVLGEAPGKTEDLIGQAFIGPAGKLLDQMLSEAGLSSQNIYFTNTILCHPTDKLGGTDRVPKEEEVLHCMANVNTLIQLCSPRVIIIAGAIPDRYYGKTTVCPIIKIQHPSFILRQGGKASPYYTKNLRALEEINAIL
jgi:uracil-DNA glycosylase family 4